MKYRPSPRFLKIVIPAGTLAAALWFGVLPDLREADAIVRPGEIVFPTERPGTAASGAAQGVSLKSSRTNRVAGAKDWLEQGFDQVMSWKHNPWRRNKPFPGAHFQQMLGSKDPVEQAKAREIQRLAEAWWKRMMERYPELAVAAKNVPDERNGFLKWLDFTDRMKALAKDPHSASIGLAPEMSGYINGKDAWNPDATRSWLAANKTLMDEVRAMGLMTEASTAGIPVDRYFFLQSRLAKECADALFMEARLAAESGDTAAAMESIRAAKGLADHLVGIESPTLLNATVQILLQLGLEQRVFSDILPALPAGSRDPAAWEAILDPKVGQPADFAGLMKGEWSVTLRYWILPSMLDPGEPNAPSDAGALLDAFSSPFAELARSHESAKFGDDPGWPFDAGTSAAGLSSESREMIEMLFVGAKSWNKGWLRSQNAHGLIQAAFAAMKDEPLPLDPLRGQPYRWDPATRTLSMPAGKEFDEMDIKPVIVPTR